MSHCENNNPVLFDLYSENKHIVSDRTVFDGIIDMGGLPDSYIGVAVTFNDIPLTEITDDRAPQEGEFKVDYRHGWLYVAPNVYNGKTLRIDFQSRGIELTPASRIYTCDKNGKADIYTTLQNYIDMANGAISFTEAESFENIQSGESFFVTFGKIAKWFSDKISKLKSLAFKDKIISTDIENNSITTSKIANGSVTTSKISTNAITNEKLAANCVDENNILDGAVHTSHIANHAVTSEKLADFSIGTQQIAQYAVTSAKIYSGAVQTSHIKDGNITKRKLDTNLNNLLDELQGLSIDASADKELSLTSEKAISNKAVTKMLDGLPPTVRVTEHSQNQCAIIVDTELKGHNNKVYFLCMKDVPSNAGWIDTILDGYNNFATYCLDSAGAPSTPVGLSPNNSYLIKPYDDGYDTVDGWVEYWKACIVKEIQGSYSSYLDYITDKVFSLIKDSEA